MRSASHLRSLQALDAAIRHGSLRDAAEHLGITPAAVGQRIRALETYLGTDLLVRGRSGLQPTPALRAALSDLRAGFSALDRVSETLDFQRTSEIHIVADPDWADLWLLPRLPIFRARHPMIVFNVNGEGDVPARLGAADCLVGRNADGPEAAGEPLFTEVFVPLCTPHNAARLAGLDASAIAANLPHYLPTGALDDTRQVWHHSAAGLEGFPLLHVQHQPGRPQTPDWPEWLGAYAHPRTGPERGVQYPSMRNAIAGARSHAGVLISSLSLALEDLEAGALCLPFPPGQYLRAETPYRLKVSEHAQVRPQVRRFRDWLLSQAAATQAHLDAVVSG